MSDNIKPEQKADIKVKRLNKSSFTYYYFKLVKQSGTPEYVARGVSLGLAVGFMIPFGLQLVAVLPLAVLIKAAKIPAIAFTFVSNQLSIFVLYPLQCMVGSYLIGSPMRYGRLQEALTHVHKAETMMCKFEVLFDLGRDTVLSFFAGGLLFSVLTAVPAYFISLWLVRRHRMKKELRKQRALNKSGSGKTVEKQFTA